MQAIAQSITRLSSITPSFGQKTVTTVNNKDICDSFSTEFDKSKKEILSKLKDNALVDKKHLKQIANSNDQEELDESILYMTEDITEYNTNCLLDCVDWNTALKKHKTTLAIEQRLFKFKNKQNSQMAALYKVLVKKDTEPGVLKIKNELIQKYGIKNVYLDNNPEYAKLCLDSMKVLKEKEFPLPEQIILSRYLPDTGMSINADNKKTVILNPEQQIDAWEASTESPLHCIIHECVHCIQPDLLIYNLKKPPAKFQKTISDLSFYASGNYTQEVHAELVTKKLLDKLTPDEESLLKYIEG